MGQIKYEISTLKIHLEDVILPPQHVKLGLMKSFVEAMNKNSNGCFIQDQFL